MNLNSGGNNLFPTKKEAGGFGIFLLVSSVYLLCTVLYFYPYFHNFSGALIGPPEDNIQDFWNTWYSQTRLDKNPKEFFHSNIIKFPEGTSLYYHSFAYSNLLVIYLLRKVFSLPISIPLLVTLHNGMLLLSFYLAAIGAFYLTKRFVKNWLSALIGGFIFAFSPFHIAHLLHHMHVATIQYIPFFLICFLGFLDTGKYRYLAGSVFYYCLNALSCWYYLIYIAYFMIFYYIYTAIKQHKLIVKNVLWAVIVNSIGVFVILLPILLPMVYEGLIKGKVSATGHRTYVADLLGYVVFHPYHLLATYSERIYSRFRGNLWEMTVYLGLVNLGLFLWAYINRKRLKLGEMQFLLIGMLVFMVFASGACLFAFGKMIIPLPTAVLGYIPLISSVRTPSRAVVFVYLFLGIGVGKAIDAIIDQCSNRKIASLVLLAILPLLIFLDFYPNHKMLQSTKLACPQAYSTIAHDDDPDFGILDLPKGYYQGNTYMLYQASCHNKPIVVATLSREITTSLADKLELSDIKAQKEQLKINKIKYIVIHKRWGNSEKFTHYKNFYHVEYSDSNNIVLRVY